MITWLNVWRGDFLLRLHVRWRRRRVHGRGNREGAVAIMIRAGLPSYSAYTPAGDGGR